MILGKEKAINDSKIGKRIIDSETKKRLKIFG